MFSSLRNDSVRLYFGLFQNCSIPLSKKIEKKVKIIGSSVSSF